jgi:hypothetical protein
MATWPQTNPLRHEPDVADRIPFTVRLQRLRCPERRSGHGRTPRCRPRTNSGLPTGSLPRQPPGRRCSCWRHGAARPASGCQGSAMAARASSQCGASANHRDACSAPRCRSARPPMGPARSWKQPATDHTPNLSAPRISFMSAGSAQLGNDERIAPPPSPPLRSGACRGAWARARALLLSRRLHQPAASPPRRNRALPSRERRRQPRGPDEPA